MDSKKEESKNLIELFIVTEVEKKGAAEIQKFKIARKKHGEILTKRQDFSNRLDSLRTKIKEPFESPDADSIDKTIKTKRAAEKEAAEIEEVLRAFDSDFIPKSSSILQSAAEALNGILLSVVEEIKNKKQSEIDFYFNEINKTIEDFRLQARSAVEYFFEADGISFLGVDQILGFGIFNFSKAPVDPISFSGGAAILNLSSRKAAGD